MKKNTHVPLVGGQPAKVIYTLIESLPKRLLVDGTLYFEPDPHLQLCGTHARQWLAAYEFAERQVMAELEECEDRESHRDLLPHAWRALIIHCMADEARRQLGITSPHPYWC